MVSAVTQGRDQGGLWDSPGLVGGLCGWGVLASVVADTAATHARIWTSAGMGWSQGLFRTLWRALSKEVKELVGTDQFGNKYYYIPAYKNWRGEMTARAAVAWSVNGEKVRASRKQMQRATHVMSPEGTVRVRSPLRLFTLVALAERLPAARPGVCPRSVRRSAWVGAPSRGPRELGTRPSPPRAGSHARAPDAPVLVLVTGRRRRGQVNGGLLPKVLRGEGKWPFFSLCTVCDLAGVGKVEEKYLKRHCSRLP